MHQWCERAIHYLSLRYTLFLTEAAYREEQAKLEIATGALGYYLNSPHANATTHFYVQTNGDRLAIVCLGPTKDRTLVQVHALLVHEAVHIWQEHIRLIGECNESNEFEAYGIQNIAQELMESFHRQQRRI